MADTRKRAPRRDVDRGGGLDTGLLDGLLGYRLRRAQQVVFQHFDRTFADVPLTPGQVGLLVLVARNPGISQIALAREVGVERSTLGEALDRLVGRGWLERAPDPRDRRSNALSLTDEGEALLAAIEPRIRRHEDAVAKRLSATERRTLLALLGKLIG